MSNNFIRMWQIFSWDTIYLYDISRKFFLNYQVFVHAIFGSLVISIMNMLNLLCLPFYNLYAGSNPFLIFCSFLLHYNYVHQAIFCVSSFEFCVCACVCVFLLKFILKLDQFNTPGLSLSFSCNLCLFLYLFIQLSLRCHTPLVFFLLHGLLFSYFIYWIFLLFLIIKCRSSPVCDPWTYSFSSEPTT